MRISTLTMFDSRLSAMNRQQSDFLEVGQQLATGRRVVTPSDDPQSASRAVGVSQSLAVSQQYSDSRVSARNALSQEESVLNSVSKAVTSAKTLIIQASNDTLSNADRTSVASQLRGIYESLQGMANTTDGNGSYLFGGIKDNAPPFVEDGGKITYKGADTVRHQQVDASRQMAVGDSGQKVFSGVHSGADYVADATTSAPSTLRFSGPHTADASNAEYGDSFALEITSYNAGTGKFGYDLTNKTSGSTSSKTGNIGDPVKFGGISMTLEGTPVVGDRLDVSRGKDHSLFSTLENALNVLESPAETPTDKAQLDNTLSTVSRQLDNSLDNVLTTRASVGARLNELDELDSISSNRSLNYKSTLSDLVDLDYSKAVSDYSLRQVGLQASQKAFVDMRGMSLFQML
ncbi:flagellar hook-associated protein FlgL [Modicisalibacter sp. 'Wilcox']|uniref:flagellar hook-associated protein FlgL n=1 Tax=Modicisalibacter sp. 'Wilcox' TaxID=2679914 RepID=UPI0013CF9CEC|nr:flagellar hook-associated protein FlgL [Modicisalibacter sp. 'Wilcox']